MFQAQRELATKSVYAAIGAPVVATRMARQYGTRLVSLGAKVADGAQSQLEEMAAEGERIADRLRGHGVVEELQSRVDLDRVQGRVERLRDQLEGALASWRESFKPAPAPSAAEPKAAAGTRARPKPAAKPAAQPEARSGTAPRRPAPKKPARADTAAKPAPKKASPKE